MENLTMKARDLQPGMSLALMSTEIEDLKNLCVPITPSQMVMIILLLYRKKKQGWRTWQCLIISSPMGFEESVGRLSTMIFRSKHIEDDGWLALDLSR